MSAAVSLNRFTCPACLAVFRCDPGACPRDGHSLHELQNEPLVGQVLAGRYEVVRLAAEGGMGRIYLATDSKGKEYAVKLLHGELGARLAFRRRLYREAQLAQRIEHPLVLPVYASGCTSSGLPYLVMPFVRARRLSDVLREGSALPVGQALQFGRQLAEALRVVHSRGVAHGDVKPENVFVRGHGVDARITLFDFGLARCLNLPSRQGSDGPSRVMGSPNYLAPELWQGWSAGAQSDMYSLGVTLYRLLAGRLPFRQSPMWRLLQGANTPPTPLSPELPFGRMLDAMLGELMSWNPEDRPRGMDDVVKRLDQVQGRLGFSGAWPC